MGSEQKKIVVAGKTYGSVEEMPAEVRRVYELAVEARSQEHTAAQVKLVFNGQEYESLDAMPAEVRRMYQNQQVAMETYRDFSVDATTPRAAKPVDAMPQASSKGRPRSFFRENKWAILVLGLMVVALVLIFVL